MSEHPETLTDEQIFFNARYQLGLAKVKEAMQRLNELAINAGLDIRPIPDFPLGLALSDSQNIAERHVRATMQIRHDALERIAA